MRWGKGGDAVPQDGCISPLQQHTQASPEVVDSFPLILPSVTSQCCPKFPHLPLTCPMPPTKRLCCQGNEGNALPPAGFLCSPDLSLVSEGEGVPWSGRCFCHGLLLKWGDHSDIQGSIFALCPVG